MTTKATIEMIGRFGGKFRGRGFISGNNGVIVERNLDRPAQLLEQDTRQFAVLRTLKRNSQPQKLPNEWVGLVALMA